MKNHHLVLLCFAFISIFSTRISCEENKVNIYNEDGGEVTTLHYRPQKTIELRCNTTVSGGTVTWEKEREPLEKVSNLKNRYTLSNENFVLTIKDTQEADAGNYRCVVTLAAGQSFFDTVTLAAEKRSLWGVKVKSANVVEGEKLTLKCQIKGELTPEWAYRNATRGDENFTEITNGVVERFKLRPYYDEEERRNITDGLFVIEDAEMGDRGDYRCIGKAEDGQTYNSTAMVRVKDKYAALWPFLGICAEVFVLCAVIFIYEKKRNKTELEESDTDQSPDQKNTPDHGKDSNLRHRQ